jgi:hypothetical protein
VRFLNITAGTALLLSSMSVALGQNGCSDDESFNTCWQRLYDTARDTGTQMATAAMKEARAEAAQSQTGADSGGAVTASTLTDLIPLFDALGLLSTSDESEGTLAFNLNFLLPVQEADNNMQLQLVVNTAPKPLTQLVEAFPETVRGARQSDLQKDISAFGSSRVELTYSLVNRRFGRDFTVARAQLAPIYQGAWARAGMPMIDGALLGTQLAAVTQISSSGLDTATPFTAYPPELTTLRDEIKQKVAEIAPLIGKATAATQQELDGLKGLAALVEHQPQLLFSLSHDIRDDIVGPEKLSAKLTLELTRYNLGNFLRGPGAVCTDANAVKLGQQAYASCRSALNGYLNESGTALNAQPRWKLSAAYQRVKAIRYAYPNDGVELHLPETERIEVTAGWGRPLQADRVDVEVAYDSNIDSDANNKERVKATLTYTRRVGGMDVPFSLVYANRNEILGRVDHQLSLNLGIKFRPPAPSGAN